MSRQAPELAGVARTRPHHADDDTPLVAMSEITEIELLILKRMREMTIGDHRSLAHGSGFDYVGLRSWQAGDRFSTIDWAQSSLTNFSPLIVREFEQPSTANVVVVADASASTRCGVHGVPIARGVARAIATVGMSAVFFQDTFGLVTFDASDAGLSAIRPRIGRNQVIHCLDAYQDGRGFEALTGDGSLSLKLASFMRRTALVAFVSDFLFEEPEAVVRELGRLHTTHDVFIVLIDAAFAFDMPKVSAGWIEAVDVETGETRTMSRRAFAAMADTVRAWQDAVAAAARDADLDVVRIGPESAGSALALAEFVAERRLRKIS